MQQFLIPLGIIVVMSVLGFLMQMLKNAQQKQQAERDKTRARERRERATVRTETREIDRYLRAVDAQRQKPVPTSKTVSARVVDAVPVVKPAKRARVAPAMPDEFPAAKTNAKQKAKTPQRIPDAVPVAAVVSAPAESAAPVVTRPTKMAINSDTRPISTRTAVSEQLIELLKNPDSAAVAFALHEVLGPPKCKR